MDTVRRRIGAALAATGLLTIGLGLTAFVGTPSAGAVEQSSPVCNNIHDGQDPHVCHSGGPYGSVIWDVTGGNLVLHVTANSGLGWADLRVCAPYGGPQQGADCTNDKDPMIPASAYTVQMIGPSGATASQNGKSYTFAPCGQEFIVTVPTSVISANAADWVDWAIHLNPGGGPGCGGTGTHEAFGQGGTTTTTTLAPTTTTTLAPTTTTTLAPTTTTTLAPTTTTTLAPTTTTTLAPTTTTTLAPTTTTTLAPTTTTTLAPTTTTTLAPTTTTTLAPATTTTLAPTTTTTLAPATTTTLAPATTTTEAPTTTTTEAPTTTTKPPAGVSTDILGDQIVENAGTQTGPALTNPAPAQSGAVVASQPDVIPQAAEELPRTGSDSRSLLLMAGLALLLGGVAVAFGDPEGELN